MAPANGVRAACAWVKEPGPWIVTQTFGPTSLQGEPMCNGSRTHRGVDLGVPAGNHTVIPSSLSGKFRVNTKSVANSGGYGNLVIVRSVPSGSDLVDVYMAHHSQLLVNDGDSVGAGTLLGITGSTGFSTGPHLHFEVRPKGSGNTCSSIDPTNVMQDPSGTGSAQATNVELLNGGLNLNPLDGLGQAVTAAEKSLERTLVGFGTGLLGSALFSGGTAAAFFIMRGTSPNLGAVKQLVTPPAPTPTPAASQPRQPRYTPTEQQWNPRRMAPPTAEGIAGKMRANKKLTAAEVMWGNQNQAAVGQALARLAQQ